MKESWIDKGLRRLLRILKHGRWQRVRLGPNWSSKTLRADLEAGLVPAVAILAGGLATRLHPATIPLPKSLIPVAGAPFLVHQLRNLAAQGFSDVVICTGHLGEQIERFAGDGAGFGCEVRFSRDGEMALGTGGALRRALPMLGEGFLVMYGDSYLRQPMVPVWDAFCNSGKAALMTVFGNDGQWDRSNVEFTQRLADGGDAGEIVRYDKSAAGSVEMKHIDYGLGCIRSADLAAWATEECFDLAMFYQAMLERRELAGFEVTERFYEIGSAAGLAETDAFLRAMAGKERAE